MSNVRLLLLFLGLASTLFLVIGLYKPWVMLWWEDVQNRKKVILIYGFLAVLFFASYFVLQFF
jgi:hypothetical protein